jgi:macrolide-specific efflux system membrane fusion protein
MKVKVLALCMVLLISGMTGCGVLPQEEGDLVPPIVMPAEVTYKTVEVTLRELIKDVTATGYIVPAIQENLSYDKKGGRIKGIYVLRGAEVKKGDVLVELVVDQLPETIGYQKLTVTQLEEDLAFTKEIFELENKRDQLELTTLETTLNQMETYPTLYSVYEIDTTKTAMTKLKLNIDIAILNQNKTISQKEKALKEARMHLSEYQSDLAAAVIKAPMDGIVTYVKKMNEGDVIQDFDTLISVADTQEMQIEYQGIQAGGFELGMKTELMHKNISYTGVVVQTPSSVPEEEKDNYRDIVIVDFDQMPETYRDGDEVKIKSIIEANPSTIAVPKGAVKTYGSDSLLYVLVDGRKEERYVKTGIDNGYEIEILQGLEVGEQIITN